MEQKIKQLMEIAFNTRLDGMGLSECTQENIGTWDSLTFLNLFTLIEESFNISFDLDEIAKMSKGGNNIITILENKL